MGFLRKYLFPALRSLIFPILFGVIFFNLFKHRLPKYKVLSPLGKLFKNPWSQAELNKIVPFGFSLQRQKMVFFLPSK